MQLDITKEVHTSTNGHISIATIPFKGDQDTVEISVVPSKAGQRRLRTETGSNLLPITVSDELVDILIKYGNNSYGIPPLHCAILEGDEKAVHLLLDHGASPNSKATTLMGAVEQPNSAVQFAAKYGRLDILNLLVDRGAQLRVKDEQHHEISLIALAASANHSGMIKALAAKGVNFRTPESMRMCFLDPVFRSVQHGAVDALQALLGLGVSLTDFSTEARENLLNTACCAGSTRMVDFLLSHQISNYGSNTLWAAINFGNIEIVQLLISKGVKIHEPDHYNEGMWNAAVMKDDLRILEVLLQTEPQKINTAMVMAIGQGKLNVVKALVNLGADINGRTDKSRTPFIFEAVDHPEILQFFIDKGANIKPPFDGGNTALHRAASCGAADAISILIKAGVPTNAQNSGGDTALHVATSGHSRETVLALLENGANINIAGCQGRKPHHHGLCFRDLEVLKCFIKKGASVHEHDPSGRSLLDNAILVSS